jgi:hypothetical protein
MLHPARRPAENPGGDGKSMGPRIAEFIAA